MKKKTTLFIIIGVGVSCSFLFGGLMFNYELSETKKNFSDKVNHATEFTKQKLQDLVVVDERLRFLFQINEKVTDEDFSVLSQSVFTQIPYVKKVAYASKVRTTHIKAEEKKWQNKGYTGFRFRSFPDDQKAEKQYQDFIYPITLIQPYTPYTSVWFGRDLLTFKPIDRVVSRISSDKTMQVVSAADDSASLFYAFSAVSLPSDSPKDDPVAFDGVFGVLIYELDFTALLLENDIAGVDREILFKDRQIANSVMIINRALFKVEQSDVISFEGQSLTIHYHLTDALKYIDFRIPALILILGSMLTLLLAVAVKNALERQQLLKDQNYLIENKVKEKTALLENQAEQIKLAFDHQLSVTQELESFSYSISHDLRAPLRSIAGFSNVLVEDYSDVLDDDGKDLLARVEKGAGKMSVLIDDLLSLSKISRRRFSMATFSITDLVNDQVTELTSEQSKGQGRDVLGKNTQVTVAPNLSAEGDRNLVRIALNNLLSNALKYSAKAESPRVEFGVLEKDGKQVYFVKDNGVGFDMTYANKLFVAFQRLHGEDFEGTGIGLATVKRIINRHGGKIWAESVLGEGATFYFTLR